MKTGALGTIGAEDIELLDGARAIGDAARRAETRASGLAVGDEARVGLRAKGLVGVLIVGRIELELVVIEEHARALGMVRRTEEAGLGDGGGDDDRGRGAENGAPRERRLHGGSF